MDRRRPGRGDGARGAARPRRARARRAPPAHPAASEVEVSPTSSSSGAGAAGVVGGARARREGAQGRRSWSASFAVGGLANQLDEVFPDAAAPAASWSRRSTACSTTSGSRCSPARRCAGCAARRGASRSSSRCGRAASIRPPASAAASARRPARSSAPIRSRRGSPGARARAAVRGLPAPRLRDRPGGLPALARRGLRRLPGRVRLRRDPARRRALDAERDRRRDRPRDGARPGEVEGPDGVVSSYRLERMLHPNGPTGGAIRGAGGREPRAVLLVADADDDGDVASLELLKLAHLVRARLPGASVAVAGGLDRVPQLRRRAAELAEEGIAFLPGGLVEGGIVAARGPPRGPARGRGRRRPAREADLVVVHAAARPAPGTAALAALLRVTTGERGFLLDHPASPFEPTATRVAGVYVAGAAAGPRTIPQAIRDGAAAAGRVLASLVPGESRLLEPLAAQMDEALCGGCGICVSACPFGAFPSGGARAAPGCCARRLARSWPPRRAVARRTWRPSTAAAAAPAPPPARPGAASAPHFTRAQLAAEISALLATGGPARRGGRGLAWRATPASSRSSATGARTRRRTAPARRGSSTRRRCSRSGSCAPGGSSPPSCCRRSARARTASSWRAATPATATTWTGTSAPPRATRCSPARWRRRGSSRRGSGSRGRAAARPSGSPRSCAR